MSSDGDNARFRALAAEVAEALTARREGRAADVVELEAEGRRRDVERRERVVRAVKSARAARMTWRELENLAGVSRQSLARYVEGGGSGE